MSSHWKLKHLIMHPKSQEGSKDNGEIKVIMFLCYPHKHHVIPKHKHRCF